MEDRVAPLLLGWYDAHARALPWRVPPRDGLSGLRPDPYHVWLSEVMLQQTTTSAVAPYFIRFTERWPDVHALAAAPAEAVMVEWAGLGYYSRARNLVACAREVAARGGFPQSEAELRKLPGLGEYSAAAVAAIAFGQRAVVVDANIERIVARLFAITEPLPAARKLIREAAGRITPDQRAGDFAQGMMDLGATICTARAAHCLLCPLSPLCRARAVGRQDSLPVKPAKKPKPQRRGMAWWIEREGHVLTVIRPGRGMLGGMRALPDDGWSARGDGSGVPPLAGAWEDLGSVRHVFTHFALDLGLRRLAGPAAAAFSCDGWPSADNWPSAEWIALTDIEQAGLPTLFAKAARLALASPAPA